MKKFICLCLCFILLSSPLFWGKLKNQAYADPFTAMQIGSVAYATLTSWGLSFNATSASAVGMGNFMAGQIEEYVNSTGGSLLSVFGDRLAVDVAGKLVVGQQMYNGLVNFADWLSTKFDFTQTDAKLSDGTYYDVAIGQITDGDEAAKEYGASVIFSQWEETSSISGYRKISAYVNGVLTRTSSGTSNGTYYYGDYYLSYNSSTNYIDFIVHYYRQPTGREGWTNIGGFQASSSDIHNKLSANTSNYVEPTVIDPSYDWLGQVGDYQDTNLEQLLEHILEDVEGNTLVVTGELSPIDPPQPTPTPIPIDPDTPLQDVPWEGLDTNLTDLYNQGLEEIGAIGDAQDAITDAIGVQTGALQGAISGNAGVISGAIGQAVSDIQDAISEQTETLSESASATAEATETIAEALEDEAIDWEKFDLRGLFPFCIPFDIYNMLEALDASPTAPHVQLPFVIESIDFSYTIDLDFSAFDTVAAVMRQMELIVYGIALAWATSKVIKW